MTVNNLLCLGGTESHTVLLQGSNGRAAWTILNICGTLKIQTHEHIFVKQALQITVLFLWVNFYPILKYFYHHKKKPKAD